jgi:hypothetical protein
MEDMSDRFFRGSALVASPRRSGGKAIVISVIVGLDPAMTRKGAGYAANFRSLIASKSCTPPPMRFVV